MRFSCIQNSSGILTQFGNILSFKIISAGKNVDGLLAEKDDIIPLMSKLPPNGKKYVENYYNDTAELDLGVLTNTGKFMMILSLYFKLFKFFLRIWI